MGRLYRTMLGLGVGILAIGIAVWAARQSGLPRQFSTSIGSPAVLPTPCVSWQQYGAFYYGPGPRPTPCLTSATSTPAPSPSPAAQSRWCHTPSSSSFENLYWGATCCRKYVTENNYDCVTGYYLSKAACEEKVFMSHSRKLTSYGWSTWTCSRAEQDAIKRAQGNLEDIKRNCPSGKTTVSCKQVDCSRNITLAAHAKVECTVTCEFAPRCNN